MLRWCESCNVEVTPRPCALHHGWCDRWFCSRCGHELGTPNEDVRFPEGRESGWVRRTDGDADGK